MTGLEETRSRSLQAESGVSAALGGLLLTYRAHLLLLGTSGITSGVASGITFCVTNSLTLTGPHRVCGPGLLG